MKQYNDLLADILENGESKPDRTGTGTLSLFAKQLTFDLADGFPILTSKKVNWKSVVAELLWFLSGSTNIKDLDSNIWDEWAKPGGEVGPMYGKQLRNLQFITPTGIAVIDQLQYTIDQLNNDPNSRRHVMSTWNVAQLDEMVLEPCHGIVIQFYVRDGSFLDMTMYQRSADMFLGVPFNISSYALLLELIAAETYLDVGVFTWLGGDCHIYKNHIKQVKEQISRQPYPLPQLSFANRPINQYNIEDFKLFDYKHWPAIKGKVAV